jgi:hypothetical protein
MRLVVYDRTCGALTRAWRSGSALYRRLGRIDTARGVASWDEALAYLAVVPRIDELQYWGHGKWGAVLVDRQPLDARAFEPGHTWQPALRALRLAPEAQVWFRTCETFGAAAGVRFAERAASFWGVRVAGHTHVIGFHQSGLHALAPGARADWSPDEGLASGTPEAPERARGSRPWLPRTITCLHGNVPDAWVTA